MKVSTLTQTKTCAQHSRVEKLDATSLRFVKQFTVCSFLAHVNKPSSAYEITDMQDPG